MIWKSEIKNIYQTPASKNRYHTDLWRAFWDNIDEPNETTRLRGFLIGKVRLNPEVKIRYRKVDENLKNYFKKKDFPPLFKHRRLQDQFTVHFTLALNAGKKYENLAFSKPEELLNKINDFNKKLNREMDFKTAWKYGIDRGKKELATLCLSKFDPDNNLYTVNNKDIVKPEFVKIECYALKNYDYIEKYITKEGKVKKRQAIKNLSYFRDEKYLNDNKLFKKEVTSCLDLTTAKLIDGKIITNGDVMTFLKLKKAVAKRKLYELYYNKEIEKNAMLEWSEWENGESNNAEKKRSESVLNIKTSKGEKTIYWYCSEYENILINHEKNIKYNKQSIKDSLNHYLLELGDNNDSHTPPISQINHLRDALTANMVGVICHLQKTYKGFIILEDLNEGNVRRHFFDSNENISRRLENALYNKFQSLGLVPPHVKNIISLRENIRARQKKKSCDQIKSSQIGNIIFVDEKETSRNCPYCEALNKRRERNDEKFRQHRFICDFCDFDTYYFKSEEECAKDYKPEVIKEKCKKDFKGFKDINDSDRVAAYNIAKKIKRVENIGKMEL